MISTSATTIQPKRQVADAARWLTSETITARYREPVQQAGVPRRRVVSRLVPDRRRAVRSSGQRGGDVWRWLCHGWGATAPAAGSPPPVSGVPPPAPVPLALLARREAPTGLNRDAPP